jgi:hypothetical protein
MFDTKKDSIMIRNTTFLPRHTLLLAVLALAWPATRASAQFTFAVNPSALTIAPGTTEVTYSGTLSNTGASALLLNDAAYNLTSGPATADLTSAVVPFSYDGPETLVGSQTYTGPIYTLNVDPNAPLGLYTGNITVTYGAQTLGRDVTLTLGTPVPEAGTLPLLALGVGYIGFVVRRRKQQAAS